MSRETKRLGLLCIVMLLIAAAYAYRFRPQDDQPQPNPSAAQKFDLPLPEWRPLGESVVKSEQLLTFLSHRAGYSQIFTCQLDGSDSKPVFGDPPLDVPFADSYKMFRQPHWTRQSPNGRFFASWVQDYGQPDSRYTQPKNMLWIGEINREWNRVITIGCQEEFAWSPDSKRLAFSVLPTEERPFTTEICISGIEDSNSMCVLECEGKWFVNDWSPDGRRLLVQRRNFGQKLEDLTSQLFEFRIADAIEARKRDKKDFDAEWIVNDASRFLDPVELNLNSMQFSGARYSPTRNQLAILIYDPKNMYAPNLVADDEWDRIRMMRFLGKICVFDLENKTSVKVADYDDGIRGPICWSPDGNEIFFSRYLPDDNDREKSSTEKGDGLAIWAVERDGSNARFVTTGWSPDFPRSELADGK